MKRVLIVEDNEAFARYVRYVLEHNGAYAVAVTQSGEEALRLAREPQTVAALLDVSLRATRYGDRFVDGIELARVLKADPGASHVPILIVTAHGMAGDGERFLRDSGADAFLRKPIVDPNELVDLLARLVSRGRQVDG